MGVDVYRAGTKSIQNPKTFLQHYVMFPEQKEEYLPILASIECLPVDTEIINVT